MTEQTMIPAPTTPGFYRYSGGGQLMIFRLDRHGQWWVWFEHENEVHPCEWGYIEQALGVWELVHLEAEGAQENHDPEATR